MLRNINIECVNGELLHTTHYPAKVWQQEEEFGVDTSIVLRFD